MSYFNILFSKSFDFWASPSTFGRAPNHIIAIFLAAFIVGSLLDKAPASFYMAQVKRKRKREVESDAKRSTVTDASSSTVSGKRRSARYDNCITLFGMTRCAIERRILELEVLMQRHANVPEVQNDSNHQALNSCPFFSDQIIVDEGPTVARMLTDLIQILQDSSDPTAELRFNKSLHQQILRCVLEMSGLGRIGTQSKTQRNEIESIMQKVHALERDEAYMPPEQHGAESGKTLHQIANIRLPQMRPTPKGDQQPSVKLPQSIQASLSTALQKNGILRIPKMFSQRTVNALRNFIRKCVDEIRRSDGKRSAVQLSIGSGNGDKGVYFYLDSSLGNFQGHNAVKQLKKELACQLFHIPRQRSNAIQSRCIALGYEEGGVNFMHQDQHALPYQALVLLSDPGKDFSGGELYVEKRNGQPPPNYVPATRCTSQFSAGGQAGDVVVFCANVCPVQNCEYFHGMTTVTRGTLPSCERWAIGLFH